MKELKLEAFCSIFYSVDPQYWDKDQSFMLKVRLPSIYSTHFGEMLCSRMSKYIGASEWVESPRQ